jgi:AcrR family transcriptional regulator
MGQAKRLARQERALQWRRDQVLDAAEHVFARKGFHEATMQEIARDAEYATGTLYTLFENKDALFGEVVARRLPQIAEHLRNAMEAAPTPRDQIERLVRAFFGFFGARQHLFQIYVHVTGGLLWNVKAELGEQVHEHHLAFLDHLEGVFREGIRTAQFRHDLDPRLAAVALVGIVTSVASDWIMRMPERPFEALRESTERLLAGLLEPASGDEREGRKGRRTS